MRTLFQTSFFLMAFNICLAQGTVAVIELDPLGISESDAQALTDRLRFELHASGNFQVIERALMEEILKEQGFQQTGCVSNECVVEVGKLLGAQNMVGGSLSKVGSTFSVSVRLVSVETGEVLGFAQKDFTGEIDYLLTNGMAIVVRDLITSLGADQLRRLTTAKMPLQQHGSYVAESVIALKVRPKVGFSPGIGIGLGFYKNKNLFSLIITGHSLENRSIVTSTSGKYRRFLPALSIPIPTLKAVQLITPFVLADYENIVNENESALKIGLGLTTELGSMHSVYADLALRIVDFSREGGEFIFATFNIGIAFTQFPRLW